eukprot:scaffold17836_cov40-Prasinocladus_malaysianus.AAC.1
MLRRRFYLSAARSGRYLSAWMTAQPGGPPPLALRQTCAGGFPAPSAAPGRPRWTGSCARQTAS